MPTAEKNNNQVKGPFPPSHLLDKKQNIEEQEVKTKYPFSVFFIIGNEFCERFSFYGMKAVLTLYLLNVLHYGDTTSVVIYHAFVMCSYFTPLFGAFLADSILGKFRTIFYVSIIYAIGNIILSLAAAEPLHLPQQEISLLGLALISLGTGGIKPCVSAFGGDQFAPNQEQQRKRFFSIFYFAINAGSLLSICITPILRADVKCFGSDYCFPLAFGVPAVLMIIALVLFLAGKPLYRMVPPGGSILIDVVKCMGYGIKGKFSKVKRDSWLDHADVKYETKFIDDVKALSHVLFMYLPLPIFWALFDQQGSRWTLQANAMDGKVVEGWVIKPDQIQVINPIFILAMIPIFDVLVYPLFARCNLLTRSLQRIAVGGFLAAAAFLVTGFIQIALENTFPVAPEAGTGLINILNVSPDNLTIDFNGTKYDIESMKNKTFGPYSSEFNFTNTVKFAGNEDEEMITFQPKSGKVSLIPITHYSDGKIYHKEIPEPRKKAKDGKSEIIAIQVSPTSQNTSFLFQGKNEKKEYLFTFHNHSSFGINYTIEIEPDIYTVSWIDEDRNEIFTEITTQQGAVYSLYAYNDSNKFLFDSMVLVDSNSMSMLWQIPQYFIITLAEIMYSITGLEFAYSQAPASMKSVVQAAWLLTVAIGNAVVIVVSELQIFEKQSYEFFLFAGIMALDMILFIYMARSYVYVVQPSEEEPAAMNDKEKSLSVDNGIANAAFEDDTKM